MLTAQEARDLLDQYIDKQREKYRTSYSQQKSKILHELDSDVKLASFKGKNSFTLQDSIHSIVGYGSQISAEDTLYVLDLLLADLTKLGYTNDGFELRW